MTMNLSEAAKTALINAGSNAQGTKVCANTREVVAELKDAGLIGIQGGLTRKGTIAREKLVNAKLDEMFG